MTPESGISVVIPTYGRSDRLLETLSILAACTPPPDEILVHVDAGDAVTAPALAERFPQVRRLSAATTQGPGGARNRLIAESRYPVVVSLDDDSFPVDQAFFATVTACFDRHPEAGVLAMSIVHDDEDMVPLSDTDREVADFVGCGCAYRREVFLKIPGYVPLHPAYGMEEADVSLQVLDAGWSIVQCGALRVRHATNRAHQTSTAIVSAHVRNTALLAFLRYPPRLMPYGLAQVANRVRYSLGRGHVRGALLGVLQAPAACLSLRRYRKPVQGQTVRRIRRLRA